MRRAVLHIGYNKTGTTSIQNTLFASRKQLFDKAGVLYPSLAANLSFYLSVVFSDVAPAVMPMTDQRARDPAKLVNLKGEYQRAIEKDFNRSGWDRVVLSGENLSAFSAESVERVKDWVLRFADEVCVVVFVRHPLTWARSAKQQSLRSGATLGGQFAQPPPCAWCKRISPWIEQFGIESIRLVQFEEACETGLVRRFCAAADIDFKAIAPYLKFKHASNQSMSREAAWVLDSVNSAFGSLSGYHGSRLRRLVARGVAAIPGRRFELPDEMAASALAASRDDVAWLHETFGVDWYDDVLKAPAGQ